MYSCNINNLKNFKLNPNWLRVGILPYWKINNNIYLLLGIYKVSDTKFEICALSGGYKRTIESIENGAFREFNEETEQFFSSYENQIKKDILTSPILYSFGKNGIDRILFLLNMGNDINSSFTVEQVHHLFKKDFAQKKNTELYGIQFININNFVNNFCDNNIYSDLISFMKKNNIYKNSNLKQFINYIS